MNPNSEILDDSDKPSKLEEAISWWEKKRLIFNLCVGITGVIGVLLFGTNLWLGDIIDIIFIGILMNVFYSLGFVIEALNQHYLKGRIKMENWRMALFVLGTIFSSLATFLGSFLYFHAIDIQPF